MQVARAAEASSRRSGVGYLGAAVGNHPNGNMNAFGARQSRVSGNSFASASSQNTGNVITDRSSTRVAQQPGGNSSLSLGWGHSTTGTRSRAPNYQAGLGGGFQPQPQPQQQQQQQQQRPTYGHPNQQQQVPYGRSNGGQSMAFGSNPERQRNSSNAYANGTNQNVGNFITDRSSTRIHAPPGGRSSITFG